MESSPRVSRALFGRCISKEELEQALKEKGLLDGRDIKEIISEVDADNVSRNTISCFSSQHEQVWREWTDRLELVGERRTGGSTTASSWR
jgi:hypothetical protein